MTSDKCYPADEEGSFEQRHVVAGEMEQDEEDPTTNVGAGISVNESYVVDIRNKSSRH
jgi:hypothetical protein